MQGSQHVKFTQIVHYVCQILRKTEIAWQFFVQFANIITHEDSFRSLRAVLHEQQKDKRMDRTIVRPLSHICKGTCLEFFLTHYFEFILANPFTTQSYVNWAMKVLLNETLKREQLSSVDLLSFSGQSFNINYMFFEPCIVIYLCNKNQQNTHFLGSGRCHWPDCL